MARARGAERSGWVAIVLFEISNSMKPCPSEFHESASKLRPSKSDRKLRPVDLIVFFWSQQISMRFSMRFPNVLRQPRSARGAERGGPAWECTGPPGNYNLIESHNYNIIEDDNIFDISQYNIIY